MARAILKEELHFGGQLCAFIHRTENTGNIRTDAGGFEDHVSSDLVKSGRTEGQRNALPFQLIGQIAQRVAGLLVVCRNGGS